METISITLVVAFLGVVLLPPVARRLRVPVIALELVFGVVIGRSFFRMVPDHPVIDFFSSFGLTYVMFLAGMETDLSRIHWRVLKKVLAISAASILVPFLCGMILSLWVDINPWLMGTILCTTSLGLVLPVLKELKMTRQMSQMLLVSVVIVDIVSMFVLAFVLAAVQGTLTVSYLYSIIAILVLFLIPWYVNKHKLRRKITRKLFRKKYAEMEMRVAFAIIFLFGAVSIELGFHSIIGAFIAGLLISEILPGGASGKKSWRASATAFHTLFLSSRCHGEPRPGRSSPGRIAVLFVSSVPVCFRT
jgi:Kef-type K+ transport system membrane component KefB